MQRYELGSLRRFGGRAPIDCPMAGEIPDEAMTTDRLRRRSVGQRARQRLRAALAGSLLLALIPVVVLVLAALGAFVYATTVFVHSIQGIVDHRFRSAIRSACSCSTSTSSSSGHLLIAAVGFYELFIGRSASTRPQDAGWLEMKDLNDLKGRVIAMIILVLP